MVIKNKKIKPNSDKKKINFRTFVDTIFKFKKDKNYNYKINSYETQLKNNIKMIFDDKELKQKIDLVLTDFLNKKINYFLISKSKYKRIIFKCGANTSYILDNLEKSIYIFGKDFDDEKRKKIIFIPNGISGSENCDITKRYNNLNFDKIFKMKLGEKHCLILLKTGELYAYGSNKYGQCGIIGYDNNWINLPKKINFFSNFVKVKIKNIYCGYNFSLVLMENNKLYSFGSNFLGQCGIEKNGIYKIPQLVKLNETIKIKRIFTSSVSFHTFLLTNRGIFGFGINTYYQTDPTSVNNGSIMVPKEIKFENKSLIKAIKQNNIIKIYCSIFNSYICRKDKKNNTIFYDIGNYHKINYNVKSEKKIIKFNFFKKKYPNKRVSLAATRNTVIFLVEGGDLYGIGHNENFELLSKNRLFNIEKINDFKTKKISKIKAGKNFYIACNKENEFFSWGDNKNNQLGVLIKNESNLLYAF